MANRIQELFKVKDPDIDYRSYYNREYGFVKITYYIENQTLNQRIEENLCVTDQRIEVYCFNILIVTFEYNNPNFSRSYV